MESIIRYRCFSCGSNKNFAWVTNRVSLCKRCFDNMPLESSLKVKYENVFVDINESINEKNRTLELDAINNYVNDIKSEINVLFGQIESKINNLLKLQKRLE